VRFVPAPLQQHTHYVLPDGQVALREWLLGRRSAHRQARPLGGGGAGGDEEGSRATPEQAAAARRERRRESTRATRRGHEFEPGDIVGDRFELYERVASGGFAEVWKAVDLDGGEVVALKLLHGQWCRDASRIERFEAGAKHMDALRHPGIVAVHGELGVDAGRHYYAMPWHAGGDLRNALLAGRVTRAQGLAAIADALEGLVHAHAKGLVHRDVKPHNILIDAAGKGAISDFDLVLAEGSTQGTRTGMGLGSILYAAPEALMDAATVDVRADAYGAGLSVVFVLTGKDPPPFVALANPGVIAGLECSERLRAAVQGAVVYAREQRTVSCAGLLAALRAEVGRVEVVGPEPVIRSARGDVELVWISGGSFMMGSPDGEGYDAERPRHRVELEGVYLARTPVTNASYAMFLAAHPNHRKPESWAKAGFNQPNQPAVGVSWHDAVAFCTWAGLALPSEAQWEYACRAGAPTRYWSGDDEAALARVGWYDANSGDRLHAVAELPANPWGLHDMHGNVWEWCLDGSPSSGWVSYDQPVRPGDGLRCKPDGAERRVMRGGSWYVDAGFARSAYRFGVHPSYHDVILGFRPARAHR
jgi:formylglycine-generating enzyme required for sulfatase activity